MTGVRSRAVLFVHLVVVALVGVQGRLNPDWFDPLIPIDGNNPDFYHNPFPESTTHVATQPTNLDESSSRFWASAQDEGGFKQRRGGDVANEYSYAMDDTSSTEFFTPERLARARAYNEAQQAKLEANVHNFGTPEELARARAFNEAQQAMLEREMHKVYQASPAKTTTDHEYPKVFPDGTVLLWVNGPQKTTPLETAQFEAAMGHRSSSSTGTDHVLDFEQPDDGSHGAFSASHNKP